MKSLLKRFAAAYFRSVEHLPYPTAWML